MHRILIKNGRLIDPINKINNIVDLLIENSKIKEIGENIEITNGNGNKIIDASGKIVLPGLIDMHAHFRDPGSTDDEDLESGREYTFIEDLVELKNIRIAKLKKRLISDFNPSKPDFCDGIKHAITLFNEYL